MASSHSGIRLPRYPFTPINSFLIRAFAQLCSANLHPLVLTADDLKAAPTHGMGLWGAELGLERGQAGLKNWRLGFRAAGESRCTPKPSEVPLYPLKLMVVSGETEAQRRRDSADLAKPMQKGRSRSRNWRVS